MKSYSKLITLNLALLSALIFLGSLQTIQALPDFTPNDLYGVADSFSLDSNYKTKDQSNHFDAESIKAEEIELEPEESFNSNHFNSTSILVFLENSVLYKTLFFVNNQWEFLFDTYPSTHILNQVFLI